MQYEIRSVGGKVAVRFGVGSLSMAPSKNSLLQTIDVQRYLLYYDLLVPSRVKALEPPLTTAIFI